MAELSAAEKLNIIKIAKAKAQAKAQAVPEQAQAVPEQAQAVPEQAQAVPEQPTTDAVVAPVLKAPAIELEPPTAEQASVVDFLKQPVMGAGTTYTGLLDLGLSGASNAFGLTPAQNVDAEDAQSYYGDLSPMGAYGTAMATFMKHQVDQLRQKYGRAIKHRDDSPDSEPTWKDRAADALYTAGEWGVPVGKATKLDAAVGSAATLGEQAFGEKGEYAGLAPVAGSVGHTLLKSGRNALDALSKLEVGQIQKWFGDQFHDYSSALRNLKEGVQAGKAGDIADLTRDPGAANIVGGVPRGTPTDVKLNQIEQAVEAQSADLAQSAFKQGDVPAAQDAARQAVLKQTMEARRAGEQGLTDVQAQQVRQQDMLRTQPEAVASELEAAKGVTGPVAREQAQVLSKSLSREQAAQEGLPEVIQAQREAMTKVEPIGSASETSIGLAKTIEAQKAALKENLSDPAWEKFDNSKQIDATEMSGMLREKLLEDWSKGDVDQLFARPELKTLVEMEGKQRPKDMGNIVSRLKKAASDQKTDDSWKGILTSAANAMDNTVATLGNTKAWDEAKAATVKMKTLLGDKPVSRARAKTMPETLGNELFRPKEQGAVTAKAMLETVNDPKFGTPEILKSMEEHILAKAADEGLDDAFLNKYDEFLEVWRGQRPEFVSRLEDAVASEQTLSAKAQKIEETQLVEEKTRAEAVSLLAKTKAAREQAKAARLTKAVDKSMLNAYSKAPKDTVQKALLEKEGNSFQALANSFKDAKSQADFSASVGEVVRDLAGRKGGLTKDPAEFTRLQERVKNVLGTEGMAKLAEVQTRETFQRIKNRAGSAKYRDAPGKMAEDIAASTGAMMFLKALNPTNALLVGGLVRRTITKMVKGTKEMERERQIVNILDRFITEPKTFLDQVEKIAQTNPSKLDVFVETWIEQAAKSNLKGQAAKAASQFTEKEGEE